MPTATVPERARVLARVGLTAGLRLIPQPMVDGLRMRYAASRGRRRELLSPVVALVRHRRLPDGGSFELYDRTDLRLVMVDNQITKRLFWYGQNGYEGTESQWWERYCSTAERVLEVGANIGYYTVCGAAAVAPRPYLAVEAHPVSASIASRNISLNHLDNASLVHAAVTGPGAPARLLLSLPRLERYEAPTGAFLSAGTEGVGARRPSDREIEVPTRSITDLMDGVDLLKLDVEGFEHALLSPVLADVIDRKVTLFVELLRETPLLRQDLCRMAAAGYQLFVTTGQGLVELPSSEISTVDMTDRFGSRDVIVVHPSRQAA